MKIAIMGIRGIPANYGGFETFAEHLAPRLVDNGHDVTVYCRSNTVKTDKRVHKGVKLVILPTISHKYLDTVVHTFLSVLHGAFCRRFDVVLMCNSANSAFCIVPRIFRQKIVINVDGLEWQRSKWNIFGQTYYKISEYLATLTANEIVTDAIHVREYYKKKFKAPSTLIPYGADILSLPAALM